MATHRPSSCHLGVQGIIVAIHHDEDTWDISKQHQFRQIGKEGEDVDGVVIFWIYHIGGKEVLGWRGQDVKLSHV